MLTVKRLTHIDAVKLEMINQLYDRAFPAYEKRSYQGRKSIQTHEDYYLYYFSDDEIFIGFAACWKIDSFYYIEHLAISTQLRGQGYGQQVLTLLCQKVGNIILEIDPVIDDVSQKRLRFYQHCGFQRNSYKHVHPSYHPEFPPHKLEILSYPFQLTEENYQQFNAKLTTIVMAPSLL